MIVGIGIDIVDIPRFRAVLERQQERFIRRVFTAAEQEYCRGFRDPAPHYAARFAAKEALFKALGTGWSQGVKWTDGEVVRQKDAPPTLLLHDEAERIGVRLGSRAAHVSLSHSDNSAVAIVILEH
jgi:holo-[acyl-carrier protein] synthase